jgi:hypothetical protein
VMKSEEISGTVNGAQVIDTIDKLNKIRNLPVQGFESLSLLFSPVSTGPYTAFSWMAISFSWLVSGPDYLLVGWKSTPALRELR